MYKKILIVSILLLLGFSLAFYLSKKENQPKLAGIPKEVPIYESTGEIETFFIDSKGIEYPISEYDGHRLKDYEAIGTRSKKRIRFLAEGEYYKTGNTDIGSTTPEIKIKQLGIETIKYEKDLLLQ